MTKFAKLKAVAAVSAACAALLGTTSAHAFVYGLSHLEIQNLVFGVIPAQTAEQTAATYTFNQDNRAVLNGNLTSSTATCNNSGSPCSVGSPVLDATVVNAVGSTMSRLENTFAFLGTNQVDSYSNADSVLTSAQLVQGVPTSINQIAESLLNINGTASAGSEQQSNTSLSMGVNLAGVSDVNFTFKADADQQSAILGTTGTYQSQTNMNVSFTLSSDDGQISWTPNGTNGINDCVVTGFIGVTCTEINDSEDLNFNTTTSTNPSTRNNSFDNFLNLTDFGISITGLVAGRYDLALNAVTSVSIVRNVPEPGALALMGIALAGLAFTSKRRKNKQI